jgi:hypothetical protein
MAYSDAFSFGTGPSIKQETKSVPLDMQGFRGPSKVTYNVVDQGNQNKKAAAAFDAIMAGHDATSAAYTQKLSAIYDAYGKYAADYGDKARPLIESLGGDISHMEGYLKDYSGTLADIKDVMMNGIVVDPTATNTREQYQGNVAAAYDKLDQKQAQDMASQGLNPYTNTGAIRQTGLARTAAMADAGNKAYSDWRTQYNNDMQAKQAGMANYAGLEANKGAMQGQIMTGRGLQLTGEKSIMDANAQASQLQATGYEGLQSQENSRRAESLALGQQQQANARTNDDLAQQASAKLTGQDQFWKANAL